MKSYIVRTVSYYNITIQVCELIKGSIYLRNNLELLDFKIDLIEY